MSLRVDSAMSPDPSLYIAAIEAAAAPQKTESPNSIPPLSQTEKIEAICNVYQQLIDLETRRKENPYKVKVEDLFNYTHHLDGTGVTTTTKIYQFITDFDADSYLEQQDKLRKELDTLDAYTFAAFLEDEKSKERINGLFNQWIAAGDANDAQYNQALEELEKIKQEHAQRGFKSVNS